MHYYMITYGRSPQIEDIFVGKTKEIVVQNSRAMINAWPEYIYWSDGEIIEMAEAGELEFDLVKIKGAIPAVTTKSSLIAIYLSQWGG